MSGRLVVSFENAIVSEVELRKPVTVIGRHPDCDLVIDHAAVSGRHAIFRVVNQTIYVEDLASTNGVKVNGLPTTRQVVHHLDLVEIGWHKLHYFDDSLLQGRVGSLEETVHDGYERTRMGEKEAEPPPAPPPRQRDEELDRTQSIRVNPEIAALRAGADVAVAAPPGAMTLRIMGGERAGQHLSLTAANTLLGTAGGINALVVRRGRSHFLARLSGSVAPLLNGKPIGPGTHPLAGGDLVEVADVRYEVIQQPENP